MPPALLADWLAGPDLAAGRLVDRFPRHDVAAMSFESGVWLVYPSRAHLPRRARAVIDFLKETLRKGHASTQHIPACSRVAS